MKSGRIGEWVVVGGVLSAICVLVGFWFPMFWLVPLSFLVWPWIGGGDGF